MRPAIPAPLRLGLIVGVIFGAADVMFTWLAPLSDDTGGALLRFYGPMFFIWVFASFRAAQRQGRFVSGMATGAIVALATFCVFVPLNLVRVNLFLGELTGRADWQSMMARLRASGFESVRMFVTLDYLKDAPLKIAAATIIGAVMGAIGGSLSLIRRWRLRAVDH